MSLLNSPLESSLRLLIALDVDYVALHTLDEWLVFDHIAMHSGDFDGPPSLHPAFPLRAADLGARRVQIRLGLEMLLQRDLAILGQKNDALGIGSADNTRAVAGALTRRYFHAYRERSEWVKEAGFVENPDSAQTALALVVSTWRLTEDQN